MRTHNYVYIISILRRACLVIGVGLLLAFGARSVQMVWSWETVGGRSVQDSPGYVSKGF